LWNESRKSKALAYAGIAFFSGILCFSGSLYFLATRHLLGVESVKMGIVTPIGGVSFMIGWALLAWEARKGV
jgi:uncharacterized membrane protein YgdD (TMEM256/DUF423 family)